MARHGSALIASLVLLATSLLAGIGPAAGSELRQPLDPSRLESGAASGLAVDAAVASASVRVKVDPHAARSQSVHKIDFADYAPNPLRVGDKSAVAGAGASGAYEAHVTESGGVVEIVAQGHLDAFGKRTANGGEDPEAQANAALLVHLSATGDIPYTLQATLNASGHAHPCAVVSMRLVGDAVAEDLKAEGPSTATDAGCNSKVPGQVQVTTNGVVRAAGDLAFRLDAVLDGIDPGSVRTDALHADWDIVLTLHPAACALKGVVKDGAASDGHENPLDGVRVQLWRGNNPVGDPVATDLTGTYCIPAERGVTDPGDYALRATLIDEAHNPPLFETRYATETEATFREIPVTEADFGGPEKDIEFTTAGADSSSVPRNLADIANIHYQSERFIRWILEKLNVSPATFGRVTILTFDSTNGGRSFEAGATVHVADIKSTYSRRNLPNSNGPENAEWHEITHWLEFRLGIADLSGPACDGRANHGGWQNTSTCDSLQEGFAMFLPTLASLDLDASAGPGYGTPDYAEFGSLEQNSYWPWDLFHTADDIEGREDLAVAQLLWDLADNTPDENPNLYWFDINTNAVRTFFAATDSISLGGVPLVQLLIAAKPQTVADVYDALQRSPLIPGPLKARTESLLAGATPKLSMLEEAFLLHGFEPVHDLANPAYVPGDPVSHTDHVPDASGALTVRRDIGETPGAAIRFVNSTTQPKVFSLDITYPQTSSHFPFPVPANSSLVVDQEVPPYWRQALPADAPLPACGSQDERLVTIMLSSPDGQAKTLDSCLYLHLAQAAKDGVAITFGGTAGPAPTSAQPLPAPAADAPFEAPTVLVLIGIGLLVATVLVGTLRLRRQGRSGSR